MADLEIIVKAEGTGFSGFSDGQDVLGSRPSEAEAISAARIWLAENGGGVLRVVEPDGSERDVPDSDVPESDPGDVH